MSIVCVAPNSLGFKVEIRLLRLLAKGRSESGLLFSNKNGRPYSERVAGKAALSDSHEVGHFPRRFACRADGATSERMANGVAPTVVQKQMRHSDARITLGIYGHVVGDAQREAVEEHAERIEKYSVQ